MNTIEQKNISKRWDLITIYLQPGQRSYGRGYAVGHVQSYRYVIGLLQRVSHASVEVDGQTAASIGHGILVLVGVERDDTGVESERLAERLLAYRVFPDAAGRMNRSVRDVQGGILLVPQFTLAADTEKGNRAGFSKAAAPDEGRVLFDGLVSYLKTHHEDVQTGVFGAHMAVTLCNDGPVTFWLRASPRYT